MEKQKPGTQTIRLDPDRLRASRRQKKWTQRELAQASGFTEDYISQLERAATTHNKGTKLETILKLAEALDVPPADLLSRDSTEEARSDLAQSQLPGRGRSRELPSSVASSEEPSQHQIDIRLDPGRLQEVRQQKKWTQRDLAEASGFTEDYMSRLERAATTRNKGIRLETILKLAEALEVPPLELCSRELAVSLSTRFTRREMLGNTANLGIAGLLRGRIPLTAWYTAPSSLASTPFPEEPAERVALLLREADYLSLQGLWLLAEEKALEARAIYREGSEEWAEITLRHCALMRQQAGDVMGTHSYIHSVEQHYVEVTEQPNPSILALIHNRRGWIADEQYGHFAQAHEKFTNALQEALEASDFFMKSDARHFRFRTLSELAMLEGGAWFGARPMRTLSHQRLQMLHQSLQEDWRMACQHDPEHIHALNRRFIVDALIHPLDARKEIPKLVSISREWHAEHVIALTLARWCFSDEDWDRAGSLAHEAFQGYCNAHFPQGIALGAAIRAKALFQKGLRTKEDCHLCLDLWILALLLHPYQSHPLWRMAGINLERTVQWVAKLQPLWMRSYYHELDARAAKKEGVFQALKQVYIQGSGVMPTQYLQPFYRDKQSNEE